MQDTNSSSYCSPEIVEVGQPKNINMPIPGN